MSIISIIFTVSNNKQNISIMSPKISTQGLTPPQQKIVDMLNNGYVIKEINQHHLSGGQWVWFKDGKEYPAGKVYRAYCNAARIVKDKHNIDIFKSIIR